ncbi:hypothetical protein KUCAC02_024400 [Chaenocephalus aceratus]|uniref:Uncharacterized protein n=1 Tax=Chaenocephalus aceratus TaxID=36190 RepID=A0ACB9WIN0_CHAAC|nr:hypothetical protein KUCAC02_024400 [Chaenocephalus aceratus]
MLLSPRVLILSQSNLAEWTLGDPTRYVVRLGDYHTEEQDDFERTLSPERIVIHRKYHSQGWEHDIALLQLKGTEGSCVAFNPHTAAVCLPQAGSRRETRPTACVITGWGLTGNFLLHHLFLFHSSNVFILPSES